MRTPPIHLLAETLLQALHTPYPSLPAIQTLCTTLFHEKTSISPVLLEALTTLINHHPPLSTQLLSCLLLLTTTPPTWKALSTSKLFFKYPDFISVLAQTLTCTNPCLRNSNPSVSQALLTLSQLRQNHFPFQLYRLPLTPFALSVRYACNAANGERLLQQLLLTASSDVFESLSDEDVAAVLNLHLPKALPFAHRVKIALMNNSPARVDVIAALQRQHPHSALTKSLALPHKQNSSSAPTPEEVYTEIRQATKANNIAQIHAKANKWLDTNPLLVAVAYIASPDNLRRLVESKPAIAALVPQTSLALHSPVDEGLDNALADLLATLPDLSNLLCRQGQWTELTLKRLALIHPQLVMRRVSCLYAAIYTVLHGLSTASQRYSPQALHVVQVMLEVMLSLPDASSSAHVQKTCTAVLDMLLDENRHENGVPDLFAPVAIPVFKLLHPVGNFRTQLLAIVNAKGTSETIRQAAQTGI